MWVYLREWLKLGAAIPDKDDITQDLIAVEYFVTNNSQIQLVAKKDMKKLGLISPDLGDALALTFAAPIVKKKAIDKYKDGTNRVQTQYNVFKRR